MDPDSDPDPEHCSDFGSGSGSRRPKKAYGSYGSGSSTLITELRHEKLTLQCVGGLGLQLGEDVERVEVHAGNGDVVAVHLSPAVLRIRDVYPGSRIPDPKTATKERGEKKFVVIPFFCSHKFHKIENYFSFLSAEEKNLGQFSKRITERFTQKLSLRSQKYGFGIRDPVITYSGSPGSKRHRIRIRSTAWAASAGMWGEGSQPPRTRLGWLVRLMRPRCATSTSRLASARGNTTTGLSAAKRKMIVELEEQQLLNYRQCF
jgi:hypothetical protein